MNKLDLFDFDGDGKHDLFDDIIGYEIIFGSDSENAEKSTSDDEKETK